VLEAQQGDGRRYGHLLLSGTTGNRALNNQAESLTVVRATALMPERGLKLCNKPNYKT